MSTSSDTSWLLSIFFSPPAGTRRKGWDPCSPRTHPCTFLTIRRMVAGGRTTPKSQRINLHTPTRMHKMISHISAKPLFLRHAMSQGSTQVTHGALRLHTRERKHRRKTNEQACTMLEIAWGRVYGAVFCPHGNAIECCVRF